MIEIPMQVPEQFLSRLVSGDLVRHGTILQEAASGKIVGHLKEVGQLGMTLSEMPLSPLGFVTEGINLAVNLQQSVKLSQIQKSLDVLQFATNVSASASVATLGVSAAGFAVVIKRLKRIESKLDSVAGELRSVHELLKKLDIKWDMLTSGRLISASERLITAEHATNKKRKTNLLNEANSEFSKLRGYFYSLISKLNPALNSDLDIGQVQDLLSRYYTAAIGQLHSEFLLNDLGAYRKTLNLINIQSAEITGFDVVETFRKRSDSRPPLDLNFDHKRLMGEVKGLKSYVTETVDRIHSYNVELDFIEQNNISTSDYLECLRNEESGIVLIPATTRT